MNGMRNRPEVLMPDGGPLRQGEGINPGSTDWDQPRFVDCRDHQSLLLAHGRSAHSMLMRYG